MLNLKIVMTLFSVLFPVFIGVNLLLFSFTGADNPEISYPAQGDVLEGIVEIRGSIPEADFSSARIQFSYSGDETTWFLISRVEKPVKDDLLAIWDTSTITDGQYQLRLIVRTKDGGRKEVVVPDILVANYSPSPTETPGFEKTMLPQTPVNTEKTEVVISPTFLSANPAVIEDNEIRAAILTGGLVGIVFVIIIIISNTLHNFKTRK